MVRSTPSRDSSVEQGYELPWRFVPVFRKICTRCVRTVLRPISNSPAISISDFPCQKIRYFQTESLQKRIASSTATDAGCMRSIEMLEVGGERTLTKLLAEIVRRKGCSLKESIPT